MRALKNNTPFIKYKTHRINLRSLFTMCSEEERQANKCFALCPSVRELRAPLGLWQCHAPVRAAVRPSQRSAARPQSPFVHSGSSAVLSEQGKMKKSFINVTETLAEANSQHFMDFGL